MLALTLTFFVSVSPISGKCTGDACGCDDKCGKVMKANVVKTTEGKDFFVNNYYKKDSNKDCDKDCNKDCIKDGNKDCKKDCKKDCNKGVKYELWAHRTRVCESGQYYQNCQDMEYCSQNKKCEKVGNIIKWGNTYQKCSGWKTQYYFSKKA